MPNPHWEQGWESNPHFRVMSAVRNHYATLLLQHNLKHNNWSSAKRHDCKREEALVQPLYAGCACYALGCRG